MTDKIKTFKEELRYIINKFNMENGSNTPDFVLADYLFYCMIAFDKAVYTRDEWYQQVPDDVAFSECRESIEFGKVK